MKQKMRVSPESLEVGLGGGAEGSRAKLEEHLREWEGGMGKFAGLSTSLLRNKAAYSVKTSALALVVVLSSATLSSLFSLFSSQALQAWGLYMCPLLP